MLAWVEIKAETSEQLTISTATSKRQAQLLSARNLFVPCEVMSSDIIQNKTE